MPPKTQAELDEEERKKQQSNGLMDFLRGLLPGGGGGFGIGSIFTLLLVVTGVYFVMRNEKVQEFVGGLFGEGGKEKVKNFMGDAGAWIGDMIPDGKFKDALGFGDCVGEAFERKSDADLKETLTDKSDLSPEAAQVIVENRVEFLDAARKGAKANGGKIGHFEDMMGDKTIFALITEKPALVKKLLPAMLAKPAAGADEKTLEKQAKKREELAATLQKMLTKENLAVLFDAAHKKDTIEILAQISGEKAEELEQSFAPLMDGTEASAKVIQKMVGRMLGAEAPASVDSSNENNNGTGSDTPPSPPSNNPLLAVLDDPSATVEEKEKAIQVALASPAKLVGEANAAKFNALLNTLGAAKQAELVNALANATGEDGRAAAMTGFMSDDAVRAAFKTFATTADLKQVNPLLKASLETLKNTDDKTLKIASDITTGGGNLQAVMGVLTTTNSAGKVVPVKTKELLNRLMDAGNRQILLEAHLDKVAALMATAGEKTLKPEEKAFLTEKNLTAILSALTRIDARTGGDANERENAKAILFAFVDMMGGDNRPFKAIPPQNIAHFFGDEEGYAPAMEALVKGISLAGNSKDAQMLRALQKYWGTIQDDDTRQDPASPKSNASVRDGWGIAEVLETEGGVKELFGFIGDSGKQQSKKYSPLAMNIWRIGKDFIWSDIDQKFDYNLDYLRAFNNMMANIKDNKVVLPDPSTKGNSVTQQR